MSNGRVELRIDFTQHADRDILVWLAERIEHHFSRLDAQMSNLSDRLDALQEAEQGLATRIGTITAPADDLKAQLATIREQYAQLSIDDAQARQGLADALADAAASADRITAVTDELKSLAPNPDEPVDQEPTDEDGQDGESSEPVTTPDSGSDPSATQGSDGAGDAGDPAVPASGDGDGAGDTPAPVDDSSLPVASRDEV